MTTWNKTLAAVLLTAVMAPSMLAQEPPAPTPAETPVISIDFPGGSLRELIDAMRRIDPRLNITASSLAQEVKLPEMSIKGATVINVLTAAAAIAPEAYAVACRDSGGAGAPVYMVLVQERSQGRGVTSMRGAGPGEPPRGVQVFSLRSLIEPQPGDAKDKPIALPVETVLSAVESGVQMSGGDAADLKYHRDSRLLLVNGTPAQTGVVSQVLQNLEQDQRQARQMLEQERHRQEQTAARQRAAGGDSPKVDK